MQYSDQRADLSFSVLMVKGDPSMKPSDLFVGVIDFFSTLVPGAVAVYLIVSANAGRIPPQWPEIERGSPEGWVVFLVCAYLLGHLISAVGSALLDPFYDRFYVRWKRGSDEYIRARMDSGPEAPWFAVFKERLKLLRPKDFKLEDELLSAAKALKREQLLETDKAAIVNPVAISTYKWAGSVVRLKSPAAIAEVDSLSAQSKMFRSLSVLLPFAAYWGEWFGPLAVLIWCALFLVCLWRFQYLRWEATKSVYEYFIVSCLLKTDREPD